MAVLRRNIVRCGSSSRGSPGWPPRPAPWRPYDDRDPYLKSGNAEAFLRALYLQLALGPEPPEVRPDLLLVLVDALRDDQPAVPAGPPAAVSRALQRVPAA